MKLAESTEYDIEQLSRWVTSDPHHAGQDPSWWLTGSGLLSFCLKDRLGCVCYVRLDKNELDSTIRLHCQFAPYSEVSRIRLIKGMLWCVPVVQEFCKQQKASGVVFESINPSLIQFMEKKFGFQPKGEDDYMLSLKVSA